jgi:hypothetical protein
MEATMLLCDWAEEVNGKLYIMGGGWNRSGSATPITMGLAVLLKVEWEETNHRHRLSVRLLTEDGEPVDLEGGRVEISNIEFEIGRPPGVPAGTHFNAPFAFNFQAVPLRPGRYVWHCLIGEDTDVATATFDVV